ncbi:MAG: galactitol-1-phosphate 5-dehydrogenase [Planctomycetota bacterium]|nr:galactitol-1-phosphate 5-dehydrogenase [Planctomycetota bacterium]
MRALLLTEYKHFEVTDMPQPDVGPDDVLVRVRACGICGSDIHGFDGSSGRRIPPLVMGHEAAGTVAAVGANVDGFGEGDRVTFDSMISCGRCAYCDRGQYNLCDNRQVLGVSCGDYRRHGAFAEFVVVPQRIVYPLPEALSFEHAAMVEPVSVALHAANLARVSLGESAVVVGSGMIGLLVIQCLRLAGCGQIIAVDLSDDRLALAEQLGADVGINAAGTDVDAAIEAELRGDGADVAVEAVGNTVAVRTAITAVRKGGRVVLVGNLSPQIEFDLQSVVTREISVLGSCASSGEYDVCIDLLASGKIDADPLITARSSLDEAAGWFDRLYGQESGLMKVIVQP